MLLDLASLQKSPEKTGVFHLTKELANLPIGGEELPLASPVQVEATAVKEGKLLRLHGIARTSVKTHCNRCLQEVEQGLAAEFDGVFCHASEVEELPLQEDGEDEDSPITVYEGHTLDIGDMVVEALILAAPMKVLCKEDCSGLCSSCGINRNEGTCQCGGEEIDPRLAVLKGLFKK